ncbi:hypothetical protein HCEG_02579 [Histoplasma capsulatum var. duboisii H88]|uniref:Uncharacterized protein n=2 Tax=Ajellomyces capsulatus TaxID=5037 RepID=F0UCT8_AJEC8|nr:hypothetical protein HCDG_03764 [Histoplasma capsulatum H143]EGC43364.1 hypothetical protein HCEG_02579 [Histoplasma capsulatum var. duboisii H88]
MNIEGKQMIPITRFSQVSALCHQCVTFESSHPVYIVFCLGCLQQQAEKPMSKCNPRKLPATVFKPFV